MSTNGQAQSSNAADFHAQADDVFGRIATGGDASAYHYLLKGIKEFPSAEALATELSSMGFEDVSFERLSLGIVVIHIARKPLPRHR